MDGGGDGIFFLSLSNQREKYNYHCWQHINVKNETRANVILINHSVTAYALHAIQRKHLQIPKVLNIRNNTFILPKTAMEMHPGTKIK